MQSRAEADRLMERQHYPSEYEDCNNCYEDEEGLFDEEEDLDECAVFCGMPKENTCPDCPFFNTQDEDADKEPTDE
jgi:hypothetical protein